LEGTSEFPQSMVPPSLHPTGYLVHQHVLLVVKIGRMTENETSIGISVR